MSASLPPMTGATAFDRSSTRVPEVRRRQVLDIGPVEMTMLIPLWARAEETRKRRPLVRDPQSLQICDSLDYDFGTFRRAYGTKPDACSGACSTMSGSATFWRATLPVRSSSSAQG
jgi:hypothetical protein